MAIKTKYTEIKPVRPKVGKDKSNAELFSKVRGWVDDSSNWVSQWETNQEKWHRMRMRIKKAKNFPFAGCANIRMPTIETKIRKLKAALVNVLMGIRPIVQVVPEPTGNWEVARKIEMFLDHLLCNVMDIKNKMIIAIDQTLEKGFYLVKPYWKVEIVTRVEELKLEDISVDEAMWLFAKDRTIDEVAQAIAERFNVDMSYRVREDNIELCKKAAKEVFSGKDNIMFDVKDVICDYPDIALCSPERIYVPTTSGFDPQGCQYIIHEFFMPLNILKSRAKENGWSADEISDIELSKQTNLDDKNLDITKDTREGIERLQSTNQLVKIWECYCYEDVNRDGAVEKAVITIAPDFEKVLRKIALPHFSGKFPFVKFFYELLDDRWFSHRGIPELIEDIVKEIDTQHMQKLDYGTIANSPMFLYRSGQISKTPTQFLFGQGIPVSGMQPLADTFAPLNKQNPNIEFSYEREQMLLETKVEELIGQQDFTLQSMINKRQPRTLGEVQMQQQNMQQVFSLDADIFRTQFKELINMVYELWCQYGDDEYEFHYFGQNVPQGMRVKITKEELQGKYFISVRGNDQNTNPQVRMQKAQQILMATQNPVLLQTGVMNPMNIYNGMKRFYQEMDIPNWEELISQPQPPQPPPPPVQMQFKDLADGEKAQVLQKVGIQPDIRGRAISAKNEADQVEFDQLAQVADMIGGEEPETPDM